MDNKGDYMIKNKSRFRLISLFVILSIFCTLIFTGDVSADSASNESKTEINDEWGYFTLLYDNSNGLTTSEANAVAQIGIGFIWIGGYSGLTRYD